MGNSPTSGEMAYDIVFNKDHRLGEGSFGVVFKIRAKASGQFYAGKFFKSQLGTMGRKDQLGIKRELEIMKENFHPFVIQYVEHFDYKERHLCIVTKYAPGGDLEKFIQKEDKISE